MKKFILFASVLLLTNCTFASDITPVLSNHQVVYLPASKTWSEGAMADNRIVLSKKTSVGTGNYSVYYYPDNKEAIMLGSDYEFLHDGHLIACHNSDLKFFEVVYNKNKFEEQELSLEQVQSLFPDAEIIKISQFKDNKLTVYKPLFEKKDFLLLNDTDKYFHKYSFEPQSVKYSPVAGLFKASVARKITFSHFGEDKYNIYVKNTFRK